jgi:hypothetical protein
MGLLDKRLGKQTTSTLYNAPQARLSDFYAEEPQPYQTSSDFEIRAISELTRLSNLCSKMYNEIKLIRLGMPEESQKVIELYESDDILDNLQAKGFEDKSNL